MQKNFSYELFEKALLRNSLSAYDFCKLAKIHSGTVSNWKNVKEVKKLSHRAAIERVLEVKYDDLCEPSGLDGEKSKKTTLKSTDLLPSERSDTILWPIIGRAAGGAVDRGFGNKRVYDIRRQLYACINYIRGPKWIRSDSSRRINVSCVAGRN